jgi:hypothetical protein
MLAMMSVMSLMWPSKLAQSSSLADVSEVSACKALGIGMANAAGAEDGLEDEGGAIGLPIFGMAARLARGGFGTGVAAFAFAVIFLLHCFAFRLALGAGMAPLDLAQLGLALGVVELGLELGLELGVVDLCLFVRVVVELDVVELGIAELGLGTSAFAQLEILLATALARPARTVTHGGRTAGEEEDEAASVVVGVAVDGVEGENISSNVKVFLVFFFTAFVVGDIAMY